MSLNYSIPAPSTIYIYRERERERERVSLTGLGQSVVALKCLFGIHLKNHATRGRCLTSSILLQLFLEYFFYFTKTCKIIERIKKISWETFQVSNLFRKIDPLKTTLSLDIKKKKKPTLS